MGKNENKNDGYIRFYFDFLLMASTHHTAVLPFEFITDCALEAVREVVELVQSVGNHGCK